MSDTNLPLLALGAGAGAVLMWASSKKTPGPLPPGPKGLPIVGNVADMPQEESWLTFAEWGKRYGGLVSVTLLGQPMVIINSAQVMDEFDKKGSIYSDRPVLPMGGDLVGYDNTLVLLRYTSRFRVYRKHFARYIGSGKPIQDLHPLIEHEGRRYLKRTLKEPKEILAHLRKLAGGIILRLTYGYEVQDGSDPYVNLIEGANENFNVASVPGAFVVDLFPSLLKVPEWLPGMGFKALARKWRKDTDAMVELPFEYTKQKIAAGEAPKSFVSTALDNVSSMSKEEAADLKLIASSMYGGGADTTVSSEYAFILAMVLFPEVQAKAQEELDRVIGTDRLPTLADQDSLPYIKAVVTEALRWNSVAPTGVPHVATEDGFVGGYFIPKGALILANLWAMLHDEDMYPEPFKFDPERYISGTNGTTQPDPRKICFGFGRRVCPGMYLAEASLFSFVSITLATFSISKALDKDGKPITPQHINTSGTISYPKAFECDIKPRSTKAAELIAEEH